MAADPFDPYLRRFEQDRRLVAEALFALFDSQFQADLLDGKSPEKAWLLDFVFDSSLANRLGAYAEALAEDKQIRDASLLAAPSHGPRRI